MTVTFTIPYPFLRAILAELRRQPYHVAVGDAGFNVLPSEDREILARSFRFVHEGALRHRHRENPSPRFEIGFVPFTLSRPQVWEAVAFAARVEGDIPSGPTCSILLGSGNDVGLFTGVFSHHTQIDPVQTLNVVGPGMQRLAAVDFQALHRHPLSSNEAERWSRLIGALGGPEAWQRLRALHFCIVGVGRTGSLVAQTLAKHGVRNLSLIDPDRVELHNLDAMDAVTEQDLGRVKVEAVAEHLHRELPHTQVATLPGSVLTTEARVLMKTADVLVCCVDDDSARLAVGLLASCYGKLLLDIGTGIFNEQTDQPSARNGQPARTPVRRVGADVRLILPGDGCLLCWGSVANFAAAMQRLRHAATEDPAVHPARRAWHEERAGSLRSLNQTAVHCGLRLIEVLVTSQLTRSSWLRLEEDRLGIPSLRSVPVRSLRACPGCALLGRGDGSSVPFSA